MGLPHGPVTRKSSTLAKGYRGRRNNVYRIAKQAVMRAGQYAYRDRRNKKRVFRALWITRINAAVRRARHDLQRVHQRPEEGVDRTGPQGAGRHGCVRQGLLLLPIVKQVKAAAVPR